MPVSSGGWRGPRPRRELRSVALLAAPFAVLCGCWIGGLRLNLTGSIPIGIYLAARGTTTSARLTRGALVLVCLPGETAAWATVRGYVPRGTACPGEAMPLGKPILALPGDTVTVTGAGLLINGRPAPSSRPLRADHRGRLLSAMPEGRYLVRPGELWIVSSYSPFSFDSRYFGAVPIANVRSRLRLLWSLERP